MSKFTQALEKIQTSRHPKEKTEKLKPIPSFDLVEEVNVNEAAWERGIPTVKNSTPDKRVINYHYPNSVISEQYRSLRTNLKTALSKDNAKVIMVSSSINGEGKTVTSINLAYSLAEAGACKIALVDADVRRGRVATYLGFGKDLPGLTTYLTSQDMSAKEVMVRNSLKNLYIIPRGPIPKNPAHVVSSEKFRNLIGELKKNFDYVIIDAPPIMSVADAAIFGRETDGMVMVIQTGRTPKTVIAHALQLFKQASIKLFGYVLTNVEFQSSDYRYYTYEYYRDGAEETKSGLKEKTDFFFKKMGLGFELKEEKFTRWLKSKFGKRRRRHSAS